MASQENDILSHLEDIISRKFESLERRMSENQQLSQAQLNSIQENLSRNENYTFRKKGNEEQYKINNQVLNKLRGADGYLQESVRLQPIESVVAANKKIAEGTDILLHRQKLIRLADSSDSGWRVVHEYEAHPLAEDSDDEKKIYRAQQKADRKLRQEHRNRARRFSPYVLPVKGDGNVASASNQSTAASQTRRPGTCFRCGRTGHWRAECKAVVPDGGAVVSKDNKISNHVYCSVVEKKVKFDCKISVKTPVGRLNSCYEYWKNANASDYILDVFNNEYKMPFRDVPRSVILPNNKSANDNCSFVSKLNVNWLRAVFLK